MKYWLGARYGETLRDVYLLDFLFDTLLQPSFLHVMRHPREIVPSEDGYDDEHHWDGNFPEASSEEKVSVSCRSSKKKETEGRWSSGVRGNTYRRSLCCWTDHISAKFIPK